MSIASEYLPTGRYMTAERAREVNLVSAVVPEDRLLETDLALANEMLLTSPLGLRLTKDVLNFSIDASSLDGHGRSPAGARHLHRRLCRSPHRLRRAAATPFQRHMTQN